jgi:hypothetical protein
MASNPESTSGYYDALMARLTDRPPGAASNPEAAASLEIESFQAAELFRVRLDNIRRELLRLDWERKGYTREQAEAIISGPADDTAQATPYDATMSTPTREEIDAKLSASEARVEARLAAIEGRFGRIDAVLQSISDQIKTIAADTKTLRQTIITTAIATGVAVILGVGAFNATVLGNMVASFESGKNTAQLNNDAAARVEKVLREFEERTKQAPTNGTPAKK